MNDLILVILAPIGAGLFSLTALSRLRRVQWVLFFAAAVFNLAMAVRLYGALGTTLTLNAAPGLPGQALPGFEELAFILILTPVRYLFFTGSAVVTLLIAVYALAYNDRAHASGIAPLWTVLLGASTGIFLAGDWMSFLFFWELVGWTSFFVIAHGKRGPREAAIYYYILSLIGTAALLGGIFLTVAGSGSFSIEQGLRYLAAQWTGPGAALATGVTVLLAIAFLTKSAVFPFYMWPSKAHAEAPDDFSSFLSGVMIKYGVYGLVVLVLPVYRAGYAGPAVNGVPLFLAVLGWLGVVTALLGTLYAIPQDDMKRLMAYSTVSHVGFIIAALSMNSALGIAAALLHTFNHMVFKGGIFLSMGAVKHRTGERMMHRLGGMAYRMPLSFFTFLVCIIAAAGIPPMSGFASKWLVYQSLFDRNMLIMMIPAFFASTGSFLYLYRGLHTIYLGQLSPRFEKVREAPAPMSLAMVFIMLLVMFAGFFPGAVLGPVNFAVTGMGFEPIGQDLFSITGATTTVNLTLVGVVFFISFMVVGVLYLAGARRTLVEPLDTYTAGEDPRDWGLTPERYHYGARFYEPFEELVRPVLRGISFDLLFRRVGVETARLSANVNRWFNSPQLGTILVMIAIVLILYIVGRVS